VLELAIRNVLVDPGLVTGPDDRGLLAPGREMAVDAVVAGVQPGARVPGEVDLLVVRVEHLGPGVEPVEDLCLLAPECRGIRERLLVDALVLVETLDVRVFPDVRRDVVDVVRQSGLRCAGATKRPV